jgi:hypothetical protein
MSWFAPRAVTAQAQAESQNLAAAMTVERGITCLDSEELADHVSTWLGSDRVSAPLAIEVHGSPHFARTVWFRIRRGDSILAERRFEPAPARCDALHAAVGLAIALALKASLLDSLIGAQAHGDANRSFRITGQALGGFAVVPGLDFGLSLGLQHSFAERLAARLSFAGLLGPRGDFQQDQGRFKTWLTLGRIDVCSRFADFASVDISACVGVAAGALYATGEAFPMTRHALIEYVAVANALEVDIDLSTHWSLVIAIDVLVPLRRTSFVVRDHTGTITATHDLAAAGAVLAVGPGYHF